MSSPSSDGGAGDLASAGDLAASDLASPTGGTGPGPLGALPTGYCCSANEQCRSRQCINLGTGPYYCSDVCVTTGDCTAASTQYSCDATNKICAPVNDPYTCLDGATYQHGGKPTGACCSDDGRGCLGGLCQKAAATGAYYCTQGCNAQTPCPSGYQCHLQGITTMNPGYCEKLDGMCG